MNIVIDTSIILAVILNEPSRGRIIELTRGCNLSAPFSVHFEIGNALSALMRRKIIKPEDARKALTLSRMIKIDFLDVDMIRSIEIAYDHLIYAYDAYILECAQNNKLPLITLDLKLMKIAKKMNIPCLEI